MRQRKQNHLNKPFVPYSELLTPQQIETLSKPACFLFAGLWNRMTVRDAVQVSCLDSDACGLARCAPEFLISVQSELHRSGLLDVEPIHNARHRAGEERSSYILPSSGTDQTY